MLIYMLVFLGKKIKIKKKPKFKFEKTYQSMAFSFLKIIASI